MNPQLPALIELQTLDLKILEVREHQRKTPELIQAAEAPLKEARARLAEVAKSLEALTKERRDRERELEAHEAQVEKLRGRLSELKTNKEYQAHLFEIEMANRRKGEIEEQILLLMERIEKDQQELRQVESRATEAERVFVQEKARLEATAAALTSELAELEARQRAAARRLEQTLLDRYAKLKATRKDLAVVPVRDGICQGCRLQLPPQLVAEVKRSEDLVVCSYCQRILYWDGEPVTIAARVPEADEDAD
ncbi:zinc ribbon domain-containing protein [Nitrospira sp. Kam-Ns4a]